MSTFYQLQAPIIEDAGGNGVVMRFGRGQAVRRLAIPSGMCTMSRGERKKRLGHNKTTRDKNEKRATQKEQGKGCGDEGVQILGGWATGGRPRFGLNRSINNQSGPRVWEGRGDMGHGTMSDWDGRTGRQRSGRPKPETPRGRERWDQAQGSPLPTREGRAKRAVARPRDNCRYSWGTATADNGRVSDLRVTLHWQDALAPAVAASQRVCTQQQ
jgi:hypothetical protein